jgi:hypothetical protein
MNKNLISQAVLIAVVPAALLGILVGNKSESVRTSREIAEQKENSLAEQSDSLLSIVKYFTYRNLFLALLFDMSSSFASASGVFLAKIESNYMVMEKTIT